MCAAEETKNESAQDERCDCGCDTDKFREFYNRGCCGFGGKGGPDFVARMNGCCGPTAGKAEKGKGSSGE